MKKKMNKKIKLRTNAENGYLVVWKKIRDIEEQRGRINLCGIGVRC
jgi:hypothetical protein